VTNVIDVAEYFLSKDPERQLFNRRTITKSGRIFYEGNARLNKYLHLAQNLYIAKTGKTLFPEDLYAYDNGAVAPCVQESYSVLQSRKTVPTLSAQLEDFLDRIFVIFKNASLDELIELSHEDSEWIAKHSFYDKPNQRMNSIAKAGEYAVQYKDIIKVMDRMSL